MNELQALLETYKEPALALVGIVAIVWTFVRRTGQIAAWLLRDSPTNEQHQLFDAVMRKLTEGYGDWQITAKDCIVLFDDEKVQTMRIDHDIGRIIVGDHVVQDMLTRRQWRKIMREARALDARLQEQRQAAQVTAAIVAARRV